MGETRQYDFALEQDRQDPLHHWRDQYHIPKQKDGLPAVYLCGNSLGLQSKRSKHDVADVMKSWGDLGVKGHFDGEHPFATYQDALVNHITKIVGAQHGEVTIMNTLSVNIHLMLVSFYRPVGRKKKILIEHKPFPSDLYALKSHLKYKGLKPEDILIELKPRAGEYEIRQEDIEALFDDQGDEIALGYFGSVNYLSGQVFSFEALIKLAHQYGALIGFDLAHGAGNLDLKLHEWKVDFAVWCHYKYLNGGPNCLAGCFIHQMHHQDANLARLEGWWGHDVKRRFLMEPDFIPMPGIFSWQLSGPPTLALAAMKAALEDFDTIGMDALRLKSQKLTAYLYKLIDDLEDPRLKVITSSDPYQRGCQLSILLTPPNKQIYQHLMDSGVVCDWREPGIIRVAPVPLYNSFEDVYHFIRRLAVVLKTL